MGLWYSNGLHHLWCCTPSCYTINNACTYRLCGERKPTKFHLLSCRTSTLARHIVITPVNVNKVVNVLYVKFHLLSCRTSTLDRHIVITPVNVNKVVNVLYVKFHLLSCRTSTLPRRTIAVQCRHFVYVFPNHDRL